MDFSKTLPCPYTLTSSDQGIVMKYMDWIGNSETFPLLLSNMCAIKLPISLKSTRIRIICMKNFFLNPILHKENPVLSIELDDEISHGFIRIELRPYTSAINFTCVSFHPKGISLIINFVNLLFYDGKYEIKKDEIILLKFHS